MSGSPVEKPSDFICFPVAAMLSTAMTSAVREKESVSCGMKNLKNLKSIEKKPSLKNWAFSCFKKPFPIV